MNRLNKKTPKKCLKRLHRQGRNLNKAWTNQSDGMKFKIDRFDNFWELESRKTLGSRLLKISMIDFLTKYNKQKLFDTKRN